MYFDIVFNFDFKTNSPKVSQLRMSTYKVCIFIFIWDDEAIHVYFFPFVTIIQYVMDSVFRKYTK